MPGTEDPQERELPITIVIPSLIDQQQQQDTTPELLPSQQEQDRTLVEEQLRTTTKLPESAAAAKEAIQELSLSSQAAINGAKFDPKPLVMSRGNSSISSFEDLSNPNSPATGGTSSPPPSTTAKFYAAKTHPLQEDGGIFQTPSKNSSFDSPKGTPSPIVLTANHQHYRLNYYNGGNRMMDNSNNNNSSSNNNNNNSQHSVGSTGFGRGGSHSNSIRSVNSGSRSNSPTRGGGDGGGPVKALMAPISGALGWLRHQREKQNERHLKELAEEQMRKLKLAQGKDPVNFTVEEGAGDDESQSEYGGGGGFCFEPKPGHHSPPPPQPQQQSNYRHKSSGSTASGGSVGKAPSAEEEGESGNGVEDEDDISWIPPVRVVEEQAKKDVPNSPRAGGSLFDGSNNNNSDHNRDPNKPVPFLLNPEQMHDIAKYVLPKGIAFCRWKRLYSLTRDGDSFFQCMRLSGSETKSLMVIKTTRGAIFGGYADAPWEVYSHLTGQFHGSAQACLFSFAINKDTIAASASTSTGKPITTKTNLKVFPWTGANRYIQFTDTSETKRMLAFGGGGQEGAFGLCVEQDFQMGSTGHCDTFDNLPLCDQENFNIMDLEIWGFLTGQF